ncbi:hypothetical protein ABZ746_23675 [Streptomyces sp. NPDC020096]
MTTSRSSHDDRALRIQIDRARADFERDARQFARNAAEFAGAVGSGDPGLKVVADIVHQAQDLLRDAVRISALAEAHSLYEPQPTAVTVNITAPALVHRPTDASPLAPEEEGELVAAHATFYGDVAEVHFTLTSTPSIPLPTHTQSSALDLQGGVLRMRREEGRWTAGSVSLYGMRRQKSGTPGKRSGQSFYPFPLREDSDSPGWLRLTVSRIVDRCNNEAPPAGA